MQLLVEQIERIRIGKAVVVAEKENKFPPCEGNRPAQVPVVTPIADLPGVGEVHPGRLKVRR
jgi:hypothetical protein